MYWSCLPCRRCVCPSCGTYYPFDQPTMDYTTAVSSCTTTCSPDICTIVGVAGGLVTDVTVGAATSWRRLYTPSTAQQTSVMYHPTTFADAHSNNAILYAACNVMNPTLVTDASHASHTYCTTTCTSPSVVVVNRGITQCTTASNCNKQTKTFSIANYAMGSTFNGQALSTPSSWDYCTVNCAANQFIFFSTTKQKYYCVACS